MSDSCDRVDVRTASFRLDEITSQALEALAGHQGVSQSDVVRRLVLGAYVSGQAGWDDMAAIDRAREHLITGCALRGVLPRTEAAP